MEKMNSTIILEEEKMEFSWYDYSLFSLMLGGSVIIGIYFGYFSNKQNTVKEYLLGGQTMTIFPISMSLLASQMSGVTILAIPTDIYKYGFTFIFSTIGMVIIILITNYITMPVFYDLRITSIYEYLMLRFNKKIRLMASILYTIHVLLYLPIVIYIPALAFTQVTSANLHTINIIVCIICIFYTTIGGLKAVLWTDTLQFSAMVGGIIAVLFIGLNSTGGLGIIFERAKIGKRFDIDFDINPIKRNTLWAVLVGHTIQFMTNVCVNQGFVQKCLALPKLSDIRKAVCIYGCGTILFISGSILTGLFMYARYYKCDPLTIREVEYSDQLLPYYVMDVAHDLNGLPGIFVAGVFSASLSTLSAQMNALAGIVYQDFLSEFMPADITQKRINNILKLIVVCVGVISTGLAFVVQHLGDLFSLTIAFSGITFGPLCGLFILGMIFPFANSKGALAGSITSLVVMSIIVAGNLTYKFKGFYTYSSKPLSVEDCMRNSSTFTKNTVNNVVVDKYVPYIFKISDYYYVILGILLLLVVALPISWLTRTKKSVNEKLITPYMRWALPSNISKKSAYYANKDELMKLKDNL